MAHQRYHDEYCVFDEHCPRQNALVAVIVLGGCWHVCVGGVI